MGRVAVTGIGDLGGSVLRTLAEAPVLSPWSWTCEAAPEAMLEVLGYDCPLLRPGESEARADELRARLETLSIRGDGR